MALYGKITEFKPSEGTINDYFDRLDFFLEVNEVIEVSNNRAILLTVVGPQQFRLLKDLTAPEKPADKTYDALCLLLKQHREPEPPNVFNVLNLMLVFEKTISKINIRVCGCTAKVK